MNWARWCSGKKLGKRIEKYSLTDYAPLSRGSKKSGAQTA